MGSRMLRLMSDTAFAVATLLLFFGCIASSIRSARTVEPGQLSVSAGYLRAENIETSGAEPVQLIPIDARVGITRGVDFGIQHTWDITKNNDNLSNTLWGDVKFQLTNRDNHPHSPIFSVGLLKGYIYDEQIKTHILSLPLMAGFPFDGNAIASLMYRYELFSEDFFPDSFKNPRHALSAGVEVSLVEPRRENWTPKLGFSIGWFNSLDGGDGDQGLTLNVGIILDAPYRR